MAKNTTKKKSEETISLSKAIAIGVFIAILIIVVANFNWFSSGKIAARVNGEAISLKDLQNRYDLFFFLNGYPESARESITQGVFLDQLVNERILLQEADRVGIQIEDEEVQQEIDALIEKSPMSADAFSTQLSQAGFFMKDFFDYYKNQLVISNLLEPMFSNLTITDIEAREAYDAGSDMYIAGEGQIHLKHILVKTKEEAESVLGSLKKGKDFSTLARAVSIDPSAQLNGGNLGFVSKGQMVEPFEEAAFKLKVNQLSPVVQTQFGYHVIQRAPNKISFSDAKDALKAELKVQKQQAVFNAYLAELVNASEIEILLESANKE